VKPYYQDDMVTLYHGDCLEITDWLQADVLVTDPPYGMNYASRYSGHSVIGDDSTQTRDAALAIWGSKPALVFGSWRNPRPARVETVLVWDKGEEAALGHPVWWSAYEEITVHGKGFSGPRRPNVIRQDGLRRGGIARKDSGHPTPKPVSLLEQLIAYCPGVIADPFAGSGSTLIAARNLQRKAIGVEIDERYCEVIANRLAQGVLI
jgi:DNA modification methylase